MQAIGASQSGAPGHRHLTRMYDHFHVQGPNGVHDCLVLEVLGPSVCDWVSQRKEDSDYRLPGLVAKRAARQALLALCSLHEMGIGHGGEN